MKKLVFESIDFNILGPPYQQLIINSAQAKFDEWYRENIESAPLVYGSIEGSKVVQLFGQLPGCNDTHTARLIDVREIKKECVNHVTDSTVIYLQHSKTIQSRCVNCGKQIIADWKEVKS